MEQATIWAPCAQCLRRTHHNVLHEVITSRNEHKSQTFWMLRCAGCGSVSLAEKLQYKFEDKPTWKYYPSPISRKLPSWASGLSLWALDEDDPEAQIGELLEEIYQAVNGGQHRLAAMGVRALLDLVMVHKVGDVGSFEQKLDLFQTKGFLSLIQRDAIRETLEFGHAVMHRGFKPQASELSTALDIVEGVLASIYSHAEAASSLAKRIPARKRRGDDTKS